MSLQLLLKRPLAEPNVMTNLVLDGIAPFSPSTSYAADIFWRWEDDETMEPQYLGSTAAGFGLTVPFDLKGKSIRLFAIPRTGSGYRTVQSLADAEQTVFSPPASRDSSTVEMVCSDTLAYGDLVYIWDDTGTPKCGLADATDNTKPADGWSTDAYASGGSALVALTATLITGLSGLSIGADYYLRAGVPGAMTSTAPSTSGNVVQRVGKAISATTLSFERGEPVLVP